jgi:AcrR family transcriptional regulator
MMSPQRYSMARRQVAADQTRARILAAARSLLVSSDRYTDFSVPGVARAADVARVTVYNQFGSKAGLLEAISDDLARAGGLHRLGALLAGGGPASALGGFIDVFTRFWASDRLLIRRLRAVATLDPELEKSLAARDARRRQGASVLLSRLDRPGQRLALDRDVAADVVTTLTSFETFDALSGADRGPDQVAAIIRGLVQAVLAIDIPMDIPMDVSIDVPTTERNDRR